MIKRPRPKQKVTVQIFDRKKGGPVAVLRSPAYTQNRAAAEEGLAHEGAMRMLKENPHLEVVITRRNAGPTVGYTSSFAKGFGKISWKKVPKKATAPKKKKPGK